MALDGIAICALGKELNNALAGARIDKIHQPENGEIIMHVRSMGENMRLLLCANPSFPRVHLTKTSKENPATPPMFCMLLRKHLSGGKILSVEQVEFERILKINIEANDELGFKGEKHIIIEIMGKHSNIILTHGDGKIIDSIYHVDLTVSSVRNVLPGLMYELPPNQGKKNPLTLSDEEIASFLTEDETPLERQIMNSFSGISPVAAGEIIYLCTKRRDTLGSHTNADERLRIARSLRYFLDKVEKGNFSPTIFTDKESGKAIDVCATDLSQYEDLVSKETYPTMSEALDAFFAKKASLESMRQKGADLLKFVNNNIERCAKKLQIQLETLQKASKREKYKIYGDLLTANIYRITKGLKSIELENYYEDGALVKIALDETLTPSQNAQRYYKKYVKEKTAEEETKKQKEITERELDYLESVLTAIVNAENSLELTEIRDELIEEGYLKNKGRIKKGKKPSLTPLHFISGDGYDIYVGKNNRQNDFVTLKIGRSTDLWFHTKGIHGSHVIVKTTDAETVPDNTYIEAATLCAYYSKGRNSTNVPVDYTEVKNVKKPSGAKPGMVIYVNYNTIYVTPTEEITEKLNKI